MISAEQYSVAQVVAHGVVIPSDDMMCFQRSVCPSANCAPSGGVDCPAPCEIGFR